MATSSSTPSSSSATRRPSPGGTVPTRTPNTDVQRPNRSPAEAFAALQKPNISNIQAKQPDSRPIGSAPARPRPRNSIPKLNRLQDFIGDQQADARSSDPRSGLSDDSVSEENAPSVLEQGQDDPYASSSEDSESDEDGSFDRNPSFQTKSVNSEPRQGKSKDAAFQAKQRQGLRTQNQLIPPNANQNELGQDSSAVEGSSQQQKPDAVDRMKQLAAGNNALAKQAQDQEGEDVEAQQGALGNLMATTQVQKAKRNLMRSIITALFDTVVLIPLAFVVSLKLVKDNKKDPNISTGEKLTDEATSIGLGLINVIAIFIALLIAVPLMLPFVANAMGRGWMIEQFGIEAAAIFTPFY